jgi:hypothetical protein
MKAVTTLIYLIPKSQINYYLTETTVIMSYLQIIL